MKKAELAPIKAEVAEIYKELESRTVIRDCTLNTQCCQFQMTGRTPMLTKGEALFAAIGVRASGKTKLSSNKDGSCPLLGPMNRCTIYQHRPFGCRTHFCQPAGGPYPRKDVLDLIRKLEDLDVRLKGDGPRPIQSAVSDALATF